MARRRDQGPVVGSGELAVPVHLLPIPARERLKAARAGNPIPSDDLEKRAADLAEWLAAHGIGRSDWNARNAAIQAGMKLRSEERPASHKPSASRRRN